jgi:hypothetical protein
VALARRCLPFRHLAAIHGLARRVLRRGAALPRIRHHRGVLRLL